MGSGKKNHVRTILEWLNKMQGSGKLSLTVFIPFATGTGELFIGELQASCFSGRHDGGRHDSGRGTRGRGR